MKFLIAIYGNDETWTSLGQEVMAELVRATDAHNKALVESGELLGAFGVAEQVNARTVRVTDDGTRVVSDGPYIETKEYLGSIYLVDCEDLDRALEIAAEMPSATLTEIEVRPLMHGGTADEL
jgi:hypothetical protein